MLSYISYEAIGGLTGILTGGGRVLEVWNQLTGELNAELSTVATSPFTILPLKFNFEIGQLNLIAQLDGSMSE